MANDIIRVPPSGGFDIVYVQGSFDVGLAGLKEEGVVLWDAERLAELRMLLGASHPVSQRWSWVAQNFNYFPDGSIVVASRACNPLLASPEDATRAHSERKEFYLSPHVADALRERASPDVDKARQSDALLLATVMNPIPVEAFSDYYGTRFLFGEKAATYGAWLKEQGIESVPLYTASTDYAKDSKHEGRAFGRGLWVYDLNIRSSLYGNYGGLRYDVGWSGGVRSLDAREAGASLSPLEHDVIAAMRSGQSSVTLGDRVYTLQPKQPK